MKRKKINKKLALNKKTVANLDFREMKSLNGGGEITIYVTNCPVCTLYSDGICVSLNLACPTDAPILCAGTKHPIHCS